MRRFLVMLLALLMVFSISNGAFAAEGDEFSTTSFRIDGNGEMWYQELNEVISTNDTVTAAESGKVFMISNGGGYGSVNMTLPAADEGLTYKFIQQGTGTLTELIPNGTDQFLYSTADASDHIRGPATVGATVSVHASDDTVWFVDTNGTFTVIPF
jgi:hypothetical protein